jgi:hypothetical protein
MTVNLSDLLDADPMLRLAMRRSMLEHASGEWLEAMRHMVEPERPDVAGAIREAIEAARALQPATRNRHERRRLAALRRRGEML